MARFRIKKISERSVFTNNYVVIYGIEKKTLFSKWKLFTCHKFKEVSDAEMFINRIVMSRRALRVTCVIHGHSIPEMAFICARCGEDTSLVKEISKIKFLPIRRRDYGAS